MHEGDEYSNSRPETPGVRFVSFNGMSRLNESISGRTVVSNVIVTTLSTEPDMVDFYLYPTAGSIEDAMIIRFPVNLIGNILEMSSGGEITYAPQSGWNL